MSKPIVLPKFWPRQIDAPQLLALAKSGKPIEVPPIRTRTYRLDSGHDLSVHEYAVDFSDPAACTEIRLIRLKETNPPGYHYLNAQYTVSTTDDGPALCIHAERCSRAWFKNLDRLVHTRGRKAVYRQAKQQDNVEALYGYVGVLLLDGNGPLDPRKMLRDVAKARRREKRQTNETPTCEAR